MKKINNKSNFVMIIYDSISNSVFEGQVLQPLLNKKDLYQSLTIISFEKNCSIAIPASIPNNISVIILKKYPFLGAFSLWWVIIQTRNILKQFSCYSICARGPLAGYIALRAAQPTQCKEVCIQARGLLAAEYEYVTKESKGIKRIVHCIRTWLYAQLEKSVYRVMPGRIPFIIEAVSVALKNYLIEQLNVDASSISIAEHDIPILYNKEQINGWKKEVRQELSVDQKAIILCYNGSAKPWQCPDMVIQYFYDNYKNDSSYFLLILTQDVHIFEKLLTQSNIDKKNYCIQQIEHNHIYKYLAAADYGIIFREPHIINWTSRPTKILEYQAVGLPIIHNNTIAMITNRSDYGETKTLQ